MKITPLKLHAALRVPALTDYFSDTLDTAIISVIADGLSTITCNTAHGLSGETGVSVVDADTPNQIIASSIQPNDDWEMTTLFAHDMTAPPDGQNLVKWDAFAKLAGFTAPAMNGPIQIVDITPPNKFIVRPGAYVPAITLNGFEALFEKLEREIVGWHRATVVDALTLTFQTPPGVTRSYTINAPKIATNIRVWGAADFEAAVDNFIRDDDQGGKSLNLDRSYMFITPIERAQVSKDRRAKSAAITEITPGNEYRQLLLDGFKVIVFCPAENSSSAVSCVDRCHGDIFAAVLRAFNGLRLPRTELYQGDDFVAYLTSHGAAGRDRANYIHEYEFQVPTYITGDDSIRSWEQADLSEALAALEPGADPASIENILPIGAPALREMTFDGIYHDDADKFEPLTATINLDETS